MEVTYEVIQSMDPPPFTLPRGGNGWKDAAARGAVKLLPAAVGFLHNRHLRWKIDTALARMALDLKKARGSKKGLLVVVETKQWGLHDNNGERATDIHEILVGPAGNDQGEVFRDFMARTYIHSGPSEGWRLCPYYLWVTAP